MEATSNPGDLNGSEDLPMLSPGDLEANPADASAASPASHLPATGNTQMDHNSTSSADFAHHQANEPTQYPADFLQFRGIVDHQLQQMPTEALVSAADILGVEAALPPLRVDHEEIEGEFWFIMDARRARSNLSQEVTSTLDRLQNLTLGPVPSDPPEHETSACSICLEDYAEGDHLVVLPCHDSHQFHRDCLESWLQGNFNCPMCRDSLGRPPPSG
ncbi:hypothetical protein PTTG_03714 [Puccinia triticina 1-1 BBBD Race 1]|uniref:RING-type domain-containing protein n=2 Tax=Puccinia triticina TaxID=208348 RepID=A0A0C4ESD9_PUCT1|nr:uncharacterized protein PtA15_3A244 [Puccinia triticina]OAV92183.1 hypothetical protein PTTG_03714 [Puccinia triticina 1-1 BBBD Race 1]WAQ82879.1 hypothetical protein PtA15_3A244 [Puccinia triticina]WAR53704.1 hypothetical protein PtB15_3B213 [Puccinia triticina]